MLIPRPQENIVIDKQGRALLTGYGLDRIHFDLAGSKQEVPRWLTPEMRFITYTGEDGEDWFSIRGRKTGKEGDVFTFGMVAVKILTGRVPFHELDGLDAGLRIAKGDIPTIPDDNEMIGIPDGMWEILESCWEKDPKDRPTIEAVADRLQGFVGAIPGLDGRSSPSLEPNLSTETMDE